MLSRCRVFDVHHSNLLESLWINSNSMRLQSLRCWTLETIINFIVKHCLSIHISDLNNQSQPAIEYCLANSRMVVIVLLVNRRFHIALQIRHLLRSKRLCWNNSRERAIAQHSMLPLFVVGCLLWLWFGWRMSPGRTHVEPRKPICRSITNYAHSAAWDQRWHIFLLVIFRHQAFVTNPSAIRRSEKERKILKMQQMPFPASQNRNSHGWMLIDSVFCNSSICLLASMPA